MTDPSTGAEEPLLPPNPVPEARPPSTDDQDPAGAVPATDASGDAPGGDPSEPEGAPDGAPVGGEPAPAPGTAPGDAEVGSGPDGGVPMGGTEADEESGSEAVPDADEGAGPDGGPSAEGGARAEDAQEAEAVAAPSGDQDDTGTGASGETQPGGACDAEGQADAADGGVVEGATAPVSVAEVAPGAAAVSAAGGAVASGVAESEGESVPEASDVAPGAVQDSVSEDAEPGLASVALPATTEVPAVTAPVPVLPPGEVAPSAEPATGRRGQGGRRVRRGGRRAARRRWVIGPVVLLVVALVALGVVVRGEQPPDAVAPTGGPRAVTPVLAARRVPEVIAAPVAGRRLVAKLDALAAALPASTCVMVQGPTGLLYAHNTAEPLVPASNQKLNTAFAVLAKLDSKATFTTAVVTTAAPVGGVITGDLYLVGGGDPLLMTDDYAARFERQPQIQTDFEALADAIVGAGVTAVQGTIHGDESRYDKLRSVPAWPQRFLDQEQAGPLSALMVNDGFTAFPAAPDAPGAVLRPAPDPAAHAASVLTALLQARNVAVTGVADSAVAPSGAMPLASVQSPPVGSVVKEMLQESDNTTAELLTKELGHKAGGAGTTAAGIAVIKASLTDAGVPLDGVGIADGSGLAENDDRTTCATLTSILRVSETSAPLQDSLPVAGESGTLESRFDNTPAEGRLQAKTGTLNRVIALAGYAQPPSGPLLEFAIVANSTNGRLGADQLAAVDAVAVALMTYPENPDVATLGPKPPI